MARISKIKLSGTVIYPATIAAAVKDPNCLKNNVIMTQGEINAEFSGKIVNKVEKVSGKGLSTNDFTAAYKSKLDELSGTLYATKSEAITSISANGKTVTYIKADGTSGTFTTLDTDSIRYSFLETGGSTTGSIKSASSGTVYLYSCNASSSSNASKRTASNVYHGVSMTGDGRTTVYADENGAITINTPTYSLTELGGVPNTTTVNSKKLSGNITLGGADISLTSYSSSITGNIAATDTVNQAVSKLDNKISGKWTYSASTINNLASGVCKTWVEGLDVSTVSGAANQTLTWISESDGKVSVGFNNISITKSQISDFPSSLTPSSHTHGNITNAGIITGQYSKPLKTDASGKIVAGEFGTTAGTFCQGNDSRLSNARAASSVSKDVLNTAINLLDTETSTPADGDYYISQYVNGGTTTTTFHRRPVSALATYMSGKLNGKLAPASHNHDTAYLKLSGGTLTGELNGTSATFTGDVNAQGFYQSSDERLKTNVTGVSDYLPMPILHEFQWKSNGETSFGFIAQELEDQGYKCLVKTDYDGYKKVDYSAALSLTLAKALNKINQLENRIKELENK